MTKKKCRKCGGRGEYPPDIALVVERWLTCTRCKGTGIEPEDTDVE